MSAISTEKLNPFYSKSKSRINISDLLAKKMTIWKDSFLNQMVLDRNLESMKQHNSNCLIK